MKKLQFVLIPVALVAALSMSATAADMADMAGMKMDSAKTVAAKTHHGIGVINSIDLKKSKVNMTHEAIPSLNWPGMTMSFKVTDKKALSMLKPGEKIKFELSEQPKGQYVVTKIMPTKK